MKPTERSYEEQYMEIVEDIYNNGQLEENTRTHKCTKRIPHQRIQVDLAKEFPILKSKKVAFKTATDEIMWIMQRQSNNIKDINSHIWDEWADPETGEIGAAYGAIVKQYHQIDTLIDKIKNDPSDRGMVINLWDLSQLHLMRLRPCCLMSIWSVIDGRLNCHLIQRSGDMMLGVAFNTTQYASLLLMLAQATGTKPGLLTHDITDAHIYDDQFENTEVQIKRWHFLQENKNCLTYALSEDSEEAKELKIAPDVINSLTRIIRCKPEVVLNPNITDFYDFTLDDISIKDYFNMGKLEFKVAVGDMYAGKNKFNK